MLLPVVSVDDWLSAKMRGLKDDDENGEAKHITARVL